MTGTGQGITAPKRVLHRWSYFLWSRSGCFRSAVVETDGSLVASWPGRRLNKLDLIGGHASETPTDLAASRVIFRTATRCLRCVSKRSAYTAAELTSDGLCGGKRQGYGRRDEFDVCSRPSFRHYIRHAVVHPLQSPGHFPLLSLSLSFSLASFALTRKRSEHF